MVPRSSSLGSQDSKGSADYQNDEESEISFLKTNPVKLIQPDSWFNIPVCIVKAFNCLIEHSGAQDAFMASIDAKFRELEKKSQQKIATLERRISDNNNRMYESLDVRDQRTHDRIKKLTGDSETFQKSIEQRLKDTNVNMEKEKERCDGWFRKLETEFYEFKMKSKASIETLERQFESPILAL